MSTQTRASFAHYEILSKIGAGGMGEVFLARDTKLDRNVAIKFLVAEFARQAHVIAVRGKSVRNLALRRGLALKGFDHPMLE